MKKFLLIAALVVLSSPLFGQVTTGYHRFSQVTARATGGSNLVVQPYAKVYVTSTASGTVATIYSDPLLAIPIVGATVTADGNGNYGYYIPLGYCVNERVAYPGAGSITTTNICIISGTTTGIINAGTTGQLAYYGANGNILSGESFATVAQGGTGATTAAGALVNLGTEQIAQGGTGATTAATALANLQGISSVLTTPQTMAGPLNGISFSGVSPGVFTNTQMNQPNAFNFNGTNLLYEFQYANGTSGFATDALTAAVTAPLSAPVYQVNAIGAYAVGNTGTAAAVGASLGCRMATTTSGANNGCWGINSYAIGMTGQPAKLTGNEVDLRWYNNADNVAGVVITGMGITYAANSIAMSITAQNSAAPWNYGFISYDHAATQHYIGATADTSAGSQPLNFASRTAGGALLQSVIYADLNGNLHLNPPSSSQTLQTIGSFAYAGTLSNAHGVLIPAAATGYTGTGSVVLNTNPVIVGLSNGNGLLLPSTLTGYHGSSGTKVQVNDGTGTSGPAFFDANGNTTATPAYGKLLANCGTLTTTAAANDSLSCAWVTTSSNCTITQSNSTVVAWTYYTPTAGSVEVFHAATPSATYAIACSQN